MKICCKLSHPKAIQDVDEFVSSLEQIISTDQALLQAKTVQFFLNKLILIWEDNTETSVIMDVLFWLEVLK